MNKQLMKAAKESWNHDKKGLMYLADKSKRYVLAFASRLDNRDLIFKEVENNNYYLFHKTVGRMHRCDYLGNTHRRYTAYINYSTVKDWETPIEIEVRKGWR